MPRKTTSSKKTREQVKIVHESNNVQPAKSETKNSILDILKFGESYTSLILGIIVVIVATILLLSFVKTRNTNKRPTTNPIISKQLTQEQAQQMQYNLSETPGVMTTIVVTPTLVLTPTSQQKVTVKPTMKPTVVTTKLVAQVTKKVATPTVTQTPTSAPTQKVEQKQIAQRQQSNNSSKTYTVVAGDSLWTIAEREYKSGYNWVDIARVNNLSNPSQIHSGNKLIIPVVTPEIATVTNTPTPTVIVHKSTAPVIQSNTNSSINMNRISGDTYTIQKGDSLWTVAVRAYGDGYQWTKIAQANGMTDPGLIFSGNVLKIPRG